MRAVSILGLALVVFTFAFCGCGRSQESSGATSDASPRIAIADWRSRVCTAITAEPRLPGVDDDPAAAMEKLADEQLRSSRRRSERLRAMPLPDAQVTDAQQFLKLWDAVGKAESEQLPRAAEASRRLDEAMLAIDPDDIPEKQAGETVAGSIMGYLMTVPAYRKAYNDMNEAYEAVSKSVDEKELMALTARLELDTCDRG